MNDDKKPLLDQKTITVTRSELSAESTSGTPTNLVGTVFAQKYEILEPLGEGGMSAVYKARHTAMDKLVAVKLLHMHLAKDDVSLRRFKQEAQAASHLTHPGIVGVYDYGETEDGTPYLVMEYVDGTSLSQLLQKNGPLSEEQFLSIFQSVTSALAHAHQQGVVHRDLKPSNIMIAHSNGKDTPKIVDFGIAKLVSQDTDNNQNLTQTGDIFGSPLYMSPEQCSGSRVDERSDIYSLGCVMFESLTGGVPFRGMNTVETIHKHINDPPPQVVAPQIQGEASQSIELMILRCLAKLPDERYRLMSEVNSQLRALSLKSKSGLFDRLGGAWDIAAARRRASRSSKMPLLIFALVSSLASAGMLGYGLYQNSVDMAKLKHSREVIGRLILVQSATVLMAEAGKTYYWSLLTHRDSLQQDKRRFHSTEKKMRHELAVLDKLIAQSKDTAYKFYQSQQYRQVLMETPNPADISTEQLESTQKEFHMIQFDPQLIAETMHFSNICSREAALIDSMSKEVMKQEKEQMSQFERTQTRIGYLGTLCALINGTVLVSLIMYFSRGTQERLRKLAESAARLSKERGIKQLSTTQDDVADLDNVLQELAHALSDAEERERVLLEKLDEQKQSISGLP